MSIKRRCDSLCGAVCHAPGRSMLNERKCYFTCGKCARVVRVLWVRNSLFLVMCSVFAAGEALVVT